ncbi:MAG TPA: GMP/IMP nucleotidase [Steroidobacter sp.]|jgi:putative hydrolase of the HAD superfamily|nr:GMP/IMP nucleotidase [Steroidobacteraceae bacterium]HLS80537.1 GMP/IMP nucleotidase [Steroidobacter sp.]
MRDAPSAPFGSSLDSSPAARPPWTQIDTVLLDMDGTLLDLRFDNYFWLELVPRRYAQRHELTLEAAREQLIPRFAARQGTLEWYCTDFWSSELALDLRALKHEMRERVCFLPGAEEFLQALVDRGRRTVLVTNAHRDALAVKAGQTGLARYFDTMISSHDFGAPKEHDAFWRMLSDRLSFDPQRTLFIDDSLPVLRAARRHGLAHIIAACHPDTTQDARTVTEFPTVRRVEELLGALLETPGKNKNSRG